MRKRIIGWFCILFAILGAFIGVNEIFNGSLIVGIASFGFLGMILLAKPKIPKSEN
jgi:hypothetical protein